MIYLPAECCHRSCPGNEWGLCSKAGWGLRATQACRSWKVWSKADGELQEEKEPCSYISRTRPWGTGLCLYRKVHETASKSRQKRSSRWPLTVCSLLSPGSVWSTWGLVCRRTDVPSQWRVRNQKRTLATPPRLSTLGTWVEGLKNRITGNPCVYVLCSQTVSLKWEL